MDGQTDGIAAASSALAKQRAVKMTKLHMKDNCLNKIIQWISMTKFVHAITLRCQYTPTDVQSTSLIQVMLTKLLKIIIT